MANKPTVNTGVLYSIVADTMPMEGRDFTINTSLDENGKTKLVIAPLTDIGKAFAPILANRLAKPLGGDGVSVSVNGETPQEVLTVASIRKKVEAEAAAARQARIKQAEADRKAKFDAADAARKDRITKSGEKAQASQAELEASRAAQQAALTAWRLSAMDKKIPEVRNAVDAAARQAAEKDAKEGRSWAVDMDAPLTSLFDRQDVTSKFTQKERLVAQIASHAAEEDDLRAQAVAIAKQYIIPK